MYTYLYSMKKHNNKKGFTLIETLVSLGIFSIVVVTATGVILSIITASKRNQSINSVVNNLSYSIDSMVRDISTGYRYRCDYDSNPLVSYTLEAIKLSESNCDDGGILQDNITLVSTITGDERMVKYKSIKPADAPGYIEKTVYTEDESGAVTSVTYKLTDINNIDVTELRFVIKNPPTLISGDTAGQPSVFITIKGTARVNQINISDFFIQTLVSQRLPNFI